MLNNSSLSQTATTVVFIDASVSDYQTLQTGVIEGVETVILSPNQNGIEEITEFLQQHPQITTIHIVSHGSPGCLYLGNSQLNLDNISKYADLLPHWQSENILLYGCNVAAGDAGEEFIRKLHEITNATISASATKTGNAALGGNWELEVNIPVLPLPNPLLQGEGTGTDVMITENFNIPPSLVGKEVRGLGSVFHADTLNTYQRVFAPTLVGEWGYFSGSYAVAVTVVGNYAYAVGNTLDIIDIRNPAQPIFKGSYDVNFGQSVQIVGNYAYVADYNRVQIIDITNPTTPAGKGYYTLYNYTTGVEVVGNYAYVTDELGLHIIDITNPTYPIRKGYYDTSGYARGVQVVGNYAYVTDGLSGLQIIDITNPATPAGKGNYDTSGNAGKVQVVGNYAYVADDSSGLQIIDITNPSNPTLKGYYDTSGYAKGVQVVGNYAYVADAASGLQIIDITNPSNPTLKGNYDTNVTAYGVQVVGNYAYVADAEGGLKIIDVSEFINQAPTNLAVSNNTVAENQVIGTIIGNLTSTDPNTGNTFTYSLVTGTGATDNSLFTITNNQLKTNAVFDYETKNIYTIRLRTTDQGSLFFDKQLTIGVTNVNEAPVITTTSTALSYIENATTVIDSAITISDVDSVNLASATISITSGFVSSQDILSFTNQNGITGSYNSTTGVLSLTGAATVANYQTALRSVTYRNSSDNPNTTTRTISFQVNDGGLNSSFTSRNVTITSVNDVPVVTTTNTALSYIENATTFIDSAITISDVDSVNLASATISITSGFVSSQDILSFTNQNGITGSYNSTTGVLSLTGNTTLANYQTALRSITYRNSSDNPTTTTRTISFRVNDGSLNSSLKTRNINITAVNDAPTNLSLSNINVAENKPIATEIGNFSSTDPDANNTFTYSLVAGTGATDNALFTIAGNQLKTNAVFNFETKNSYSIRVKTTDQGGLFYEKQLTRTYALTKNIIYVF